MDLKDQKKSVLVLKYIGEDFWSHPVYKDQFDHLWKDTALGEGGQPSLCSVVGNEFDGEPESHIQQEFTIQQASDLPSSEKRFQYMMLDRLRSDCDYYLGYGHRYPGNRCDRDPKKHIEAMKELWNGFSEDEKPEWLTWEQLLDYEKKMCGGQ